MSIKDFELGKCRGDGKFGRVLMCRHRQTGTLYAIKEVPKAVIKKNAL
jgi:serine/threonine protein kinase